MLAPFIVLVKGVKETPSQHMCSADIPTISYRENNKKERKREGTKDPERYRENHLARS